MTERPAPQSNEKLSYDADYWRGLYLTAIEIGNEIRAERDKLQAENQQLERDFHEACRRVGERDSALSELHSVRAEVARLRSTVAEVQKLADQWRNVTQAGFYPEASAHANAVECCGDELNDLLAAAVVGEPGKAGNE